MRAALITCLLLSLTLSGCKKKSSAEFYRLESEHSVLLTREGDEAYASDEMDVVLAGLRAIPEDTLEKPRADALVATITTEQARVKAARPTAAVNAPDDVNARFEAIKAARVVETIQANEADAGAQDAGPVEPTKGMSEADFLKAFGVCFTRGEPFALADGGTATTQLVRDDAKCQAQHGTPGATTRWLFVSGGLFAKLVETSSAKSSTSTTVIDAGTPKPPPAPQPEPEPALAIPGAPVAPRYELDSGAAP